MSEDYPRPEAPACVSDGLAAARRLIGSALFSEGLLEVPPRSWKPDGQYDYGYGCYGCPFAELLPGQGNIAHDEAEANYRCHLLAVEPVWGESPKCTVKDWQARALNELQTIPAMAALT